MRKLTPIEFNALHWLAKHEPFTPGNDAGMRDVMAVLDRLCTKKRAQWTETDDGPRYTLTAAGKAEVAA